MPFYERWALCGLWFVIGVLLGMSSATIVLVALSP